MSRIQSAVSGLLVSLAWSHGADWTSLDLSTHAGPSMFDHLEATWTLPRGAQVIAGVPWQLAGVIELHGYDHTAPTNVSDVRIGAAFDRLHLLNACSGRATNGAIIAALTLRFADGTSALLPVRYGHQVLPFTASRHVLDEPPLDSSAQVVWRGESPLSSVSNFGMRLYHSVLTNPFPEKLAVAMDIDAAGSGGGWMLAAATVSSTDAPMRADTYAIPENLEPRPGPRSGEPTRLEGVVRDLAGNPIAGAQIILAGLRQFDGWQRETSVMHPAAAERPLTDALGQFAFQRTTDQYSYGLIAIAEGYEPDAYHAADPLRDPVEIRLRPKSVPEAGDTLVRGRLLDENGRAIVGASIGALKVAEGSSETYAHYGGQRFADNRVISDGKGEFVLHRQNAFDRVQLQIDRDGIAPHKLWLPASNMVQVVPLGSGGFITGRIVKDGRSVPWVELGVRDEEPYNSMIYSSHVETFTDAEGYFTFRSLPPNSNWYLYGMRESMKAHGAIAPRLIPVGKHGATNQLGELEVRPGLTLAGRLVPADGIELPVEPLSLYVHIQGKSWQHPEEIHTQPDGSFALEGCYDDYIGLNVSTPGWRITARNRNLEPASGRQLVGRLPESKTNLWIEVAPGQPASGGGFFNLPPGDEPSSRPLAGIEPGASLIQVTGTVVDDRSGTPVRNFALIPGRQPPIPSKPIKPFLQRVLDSLKDEQLPIEEWPTWFRALEQTFTNGQFQLEFEVLTSTPLLQIAADGFTPVAVGPVTTSTNGLVVRLTRGISPHGVVLTPDNRPAAGATVNNSSFPEYVVLRAQGKLVDEQATVESTETDDGGGFAFPKKFDGKHLYVSHPSGWALVDESEFGANMKVRLEPWATVTGTLVDAGGSPVRGAELRLKMKGFDGMDSGPQLVMDFQTETDDRGAFVFSFVPPGELMLFRNIPPTANPTGGWTLSLQTRFYASPGETNRLGNVLLDTPPPKPLLERLKNKVGL